MVEFCDVFTGTVYRLGDQWLNVAYKQVATLLKPKLEKAGGDLKEAAKKAASFWMEEYYSLIFPLRFCLQREPFSFHKVPFPDDSGIINLESTPEEKGFRAGFLRGTLPPLLPVEKKERTGELLADRLLIQAAMANLFLRQRSTPQEAIDAARLAFLTYPLLEHLEIPLPAEAEKIARFLKEKGELPYGLDPDLLLCVKRGEFPDDARVGLAQVAVQRIKRYVFETPGLNEIRGASTLLDDLTEQAKELVSKELGPEVILRAVGSTIVFLAPNKNEAKDLAERIREGFYKATGTAFAAAAWREVEVKRLFEDYQSVMEELQQAVEVDRAKGEVPITEALPFETRCRLCRTRPAEGWTEMPNEPNAPICRVCITKRELGKKERSAKLKKELLKWIGLEPKDLPQIGVNPDDWFPKAIGRVTAEDGFIPDDARRALLATIYGDGNNFGAVGRKINSIAMGLQWTQRVKWVTCAATAIALAQATKETVEQRKKGLLPRLPFQVLALGGDDLSILAWAPIGVRFAQHFLEMMDLEFSQGIRKPLADIAFSLGILVADAKAPVRRTVDFAEGALLKWAKRAFRNSQAKDRNSRRKSNVAMLLALTPEQIPTDLDAYRENVYIRRGSWRDICLTLRPFTAEELELLLNKAEELLENGKGPFQRIVEAFIKSPPLVAMLFYLYQRARAAKSRTGEKENWMEKLELLEGAPDRFPRFPAAQVERLPFGEKEKKPGEAKRVLFSPLWDVLEMVKVLE